MSVYDSDISTKFQIGMIILSSVTVDFVLVTSSDLDFKPFDSKMAWQIAVVVEPCIHNLNFSFSSVESAHETDETHDNFDYWNDASRGNKDIL